MTLFIPRNVISVKTHDMHTAGEPLRIILPEFPPLHGSTVLEKIQHMKKQYDYYRKLIINEPRGHKDMYGAILMKQNSCDNNFDVIFLQNEGYSSMCGHAVIALGRYVVDAGLVKCSDSEVEITFHCPCGPVKTFVQSDGSEVSGIRFHSVPAFVFKLGN